MRNCRDKSRSEREGEPNKEFAEPGECHGKRPGDRDRMGRRGRGGGPGRVRQERQKVTTVLRRRELPLLSRIQNYDFP